MIRDHGRNQSGAEYFTDVIAMQRIGGSNLHLSQTRQGDAEGSPSNTRINRSVPPRWGPKALKTVYQMSAASSGTLSIGHLSRKTVTWFGTHAKHTHAHPQAKPSHRPAPVHQLLHQMAEIAVQNSAEWLILHQVEINALILSLLEQALHTQHEKSYKEAIAEGLWINYFVEASLFGLSPRRCTSLHGICIKTFPFLVMASNYDPPSVTFFEDLRTIILEDSRNEDLLLAKLAVRLCYELAYGSPSSWRPEGYVTLWKLYQTPTGKRILQNVSCCGVIINDLGNRLFTGSEVSNIIEQAAAIQFFVAYAEDMPDYRDQLLSNNGIPCLTENVRSCADDNKYTMIYLCGILAHISTHVWCSLVLAKLDVCSMLSEHIILHTPRLSCSINLSQAEMDAAIPENAHLPYDVIHILRNLAALGGVNGRQTVRDHYSAELKRALPKVISSITEHLGYAAASTTKSRLDEIRTLISSLPP